MFLTENKRRKTLLTLIRFHFKESMLLIEKNKVPESLYILKELLSFAKKYCSSKGRKILHKQLKKVIKIQNNKYVKSFPDKSYIKQFMPLLNSIK